MARRPYVYACGVERELCSGAITATNHGLENVSVKAHASPEEAFNCARRALIKQGWTQTGSREFSPPGGGPIRVLTKKSRYGGKMRNGKEGTRSMPDRRGAGLLFTC